MADITMCQNNKCPSNDVCKRFTATADPEYQSYMEFDFGSGGCCECFIPNDVYMKKYREV